MSDQTTFSLNYISDKHPIIISSNLHVYPSNFENFENFENLP